MKFTHLIRKLRLYGLLFNLCIGGYTGYLAVHSALLPLFALIFAIFPIPLIVLFCRFVYLFAAFLHSLEGRTLRDQHQTYDQNNDINDVGTDHSKSFHHNIGDGSAYDSSTVLMFCTVCISFQRFDQFATADHQGHE